MDNGIRKQLITVGVSIVAVLFVGTAGYMLIEGWNALDGLYMTVITLATIGYGETHPLSHAGRIYTLFLIFGGIGLMTYAFSTLTALVIGGHLTDAFRRKKMENRIQALDKHFIVCGASHTAMSIAAELSRTGRQFVMIEQAPDICKKLADSEHLVICGDATEDEALLKAGVKSARGIFCTLPNDKDNAFIALTARGLNAGLRIIATQISEAVKDKLIKSGADIVINPGFIGGLRMVSEMVRPATVGFLDSMLRVSGKDYRFEDLEIKRGSQSAGKSLGVLKGSDGDAALVVAVKPPGSDDFEMNPAPDRKLSEGDILVTLGSRQQINELRSKLE